ncbi:MAG: SOS response-associated peptidase [Polyangiaceae bacterium]|nr:SOS response-associated peptidase [Polyangiaceae bacterium]
MCGRYALYALPEEIWETFALDGEPLAFEPRYNVAPSQDVLVVGRRAASAKPKAAMMRWGLVPAWADDPRIGHRLVNARVESLEQKPAFRSAADKRRCLVVASGYYEWKKLEKGKQPHFVRPEDGSLLALAGLWERWKRGDGEPLFTCTVLTGPSAGAVSSLHDRMPLSVPPELRDAWLDPTLDAARVRSEVLSHLTAPAVEVRPVSTRVNSVANEGPENIEAALS